MPGRLDAMAQEPLAFYGLLGHDSNRYQEGRNSVSNADINIAVRFRCWRTLFPVSLVLHGGVSGEHLLQRG